jgi:hypothetical protein
MLSLTPRGDDLSVTQQREVVTHCRLALADPIANGAHVLLTFGEQRHHPESRRIANEPFCLRSKPTLISVVAELVFR